MVSEKMSKNPNFWRFIPLNPRINIFFKILSVSLSFLYWRLTSCKVSDQTNERSLDGQTDERTDGQGRLLWTPSGKPGVQNWLCVSRYTRTYHKTTRIYSFYSRATAFILSSCKITYFSVDFAVILILLSNIFPFSFPGNLSHMRVV